jgi:hypothetical protein
MLTNMVHNKWLLPYSYELNLILLPFAITRVRYEYFPFQRLYRDSITIAATAAPFSDAAVNKNSTAFRNIQGPGQMLITPGANFAPSDSVPFA